MDNRMDAARSEALRGMEQNDGGPFGAIIVKEETIIARAHNEVLATNDPTAHAEILAIRRASEALGSFDLSGCTLYTSCYPCPMCLGAILWARIGTVYYGATMEDAAAGGFDDARFYEAFRSPEKALNLLPLDTGQGKDVFTRWNAKEDRRAY